MPHQYGLPGFTAPPSPSPPSHHGRIGGAVVPQSGSAAVFRPQIEDRRLTRDAMERYMRERNDLTIIILHAKVICYQHFIGILINCIDSGCSKILWK